MASPLEKALIIMRFYTDEVFSTTSRTFPVSVINKINNIFAQAGQHYGVYAERFVDEINILFPSYAFVVIVNIDETGKIWLRKIWIGCKDTANR